MVETHTSIAARVAGHVAVAADAVARAPVDDAGTPPGKTACVCQLGRAEG